jgi:hypothetical protein
MSNAELSSTSEKLKHSEDELAKLTEKDKLNEYEKIEMIDVR